eukprot:356981-Chlamydomonas_euryale.AAC.5
MCRAADAADATTAAATDLYADWSARRAVSAVSRRGQRLIKRVHPDAWDELPDAQQLSQQAGCVRRRRKSRGVVGRRVRERPSPGHPEGNVRRATGAAGATVETLGRRGRRCGARHQRHRRERLQVIQQPRQLLPHCRLDRQHTRDEAQRGCRQPVGEAGDAAAAAARRAPATVPARVLDGGEAPPPPAPARRSPYAWNAAPFGDESACAPPLPAALKPGQVPAAAAAVRPSAGARAAAAEARPPSVLTLDNAPPNVNVSDPGSERSIMAGSLPTLWLAHAPGGAAAPADGEAAREAGCRESIPGTLGRSRATTPTKLAV